MLQEQGNAASNPDPAVRLHLHSVCNQYAENHRVVLTLFPISSMINPVIKRWISLNSPQFWRIWLIFLASGLAVIALSVFFIDQNFANFFNPERLPKVWKFHREITEVGRAEFYIAIALLALLKKSWRKKAAYYLACCATTGIALHIIKIAAGRTRPHKAPEHNPFLFEPFNLHHHFQSFPSGHSQTLFTVATFIAFLFPKTTPWILLTALYLSFTRAITLAHFVSDVWGGALIGLLVSVLTLRILVRKYGT